MMSVGRESRTSNDLFFVCSLIDYVARKTQNRRRDVVNAVGREKIRKLFEFADVYHCENIDKVTQDLIENHHILNGNFDNVGTCQYDVPTHWDIGKVYKRLIFKIAQNENCDLIDALFDVYNSWISDKIDDYNCSMYYMPPDGIYASWQDGYPVD